MVSKLFSWRIVSGGELSWRTEAADDWMGDETNVDAGRGPGVCCSGISRAGANFCTTRNAPLSSTKRRRDAVSIRARGPAE